VPEQAALLYRPYKLSLSNGKEMIIVFRDQVLSDLIGFEYAKWLAVDAVNDFMSRLEAIYAKVKHLDGDYLVTVALDGENCWSITKMTVMISFQGSILCLAILSG